MSITVRGLGSGLDYDSWITELVNLKKADITAVSNNVTAIKRQESALSRIEDDYNKFLEALKTFTDALSTTDVFNQKAAVSSNSEAVSAVVTANADVQNVKVTVSALATSTVAKSANPVASYVDNATQISNISEGAVSGGAFYIYVNGEKQKIDVNSNMTLDELVNNIDGLEGVQANLSSDGKLTISAEEDYSIVVGSSADTSNFTKIMSLIRDSETGTYSSSKSVFDTNTSTALVNTTFSPSAAGETTVREGTFTIGDVEFTIDSNTSLNSIISQINKSKAGVTASWDSNTGKLALAANDEGAVSISIEAGTSNFTDIMGFTSSTWTTQEEGGSTIYTLESTKLADNSQELGTNAVLTINGTTITSSSNTITSGISGIKGLTLTLNAATEETTNINITQDTGKITKALTSLVDAYNTVIADTDSATAADGALYGETILNSLRNKVRTLITSSIGSNDGYSTFASIGISTGAFGTSISENTNKLTIDTTKLAEALSSNPDAVKRLLIGDSGTQGVLSQLKTVVGNATNPVNGYFVTREKSYEKNIGRLNDKIEDMNTALEKYKIDLEIKFAAMDKLISSLESTASIFDSYFNTDNNNKNKK